MEESTKVSLIQKAKSHKIILIPSVIGVMILSLGIVSLSMLKTTDNKTQKEELKVAPSEEEIANPQNIELLLGFSIYNIGVEYGKETSVDLNLETYKTAGITEGTLEVSYNPFTITKVKVTPVVGPTGLFQKFESFDVKYYPDSFVVTFKIPEESIPVTGKGRIAELTFTPVAFAKEPDNTTITYDFEGSRIYTKESGEKRMLKMSKSDLTLGIGKNTSSVPNSDNTSILPKSQ